jgi:hypothetical protein
MGAAMACPTKRSVRAARRLPVSLAPVLLLSVVVVVLVLHGGATTTGWADPRHDAPTAIPALSFHR